MTDGTLKLFSLDQDGTGCHTFCSCLCKKSIDKAGQLLVVAGVCSCTRLNAASAHNACEPQTACFICDCDCSTTRDIVCALPTCMGIVGVVHQGCCCWWWWILKQSCLYRRYRCTWAESHQKIETSVPSFKWKWCWERYQCMEGSFVLKIIWFVPALIWISSCFASNSEQISLLSHVPSISLSHDFV